MSRRRVTSGSDVMAQPGLPAAVTAARLPTIAGTAAASTSANTDGTNARICHLLFKKPRRPWLVTDVEWLAALQERFPERAPMVPGCPLAPGTCRPAGSESSRAGADESAS